MKRMLIDATQVEETRVAFLDGQFLENLDFELASRKTLKGNIYLAKVMRVEPSLQAAFVDFGGNRHGFLPFTEIHPDYFRIPVGDRPPHEDMQGDDLAEGMGDPDLEQYRADALEAENNAEANAQADQATENTPENNSAEQSSQLGSPMLAPTGQPETPAPLAPLPPSNFNPWNVQPGSGSLSDLLPEFTPPPAAGPITNFGGEGYVPPAPVPAVPAPQPVEHRPQRQYRPRYKIQEVIKRGMVMLVQVVKEERGTKGAALTTYLSLAGRYCVLMPNTLHQGGVSRKITDFDERRRMKELLDQLDVPQGMGVILRTAGMEQTAVEIQRDLDFLLRLWNSVREQTLQSNAPTLIYEEANLVKRALRDFFSNDVDEILVAGDQGYETARQYMGTLVPEQVEKIKPYTDSVPIFSRFGVERQIDNLHSNTVQLRSGGYLVINTTEALVAIDVNSGRSTRERHIEETAYRTNLEAAQEVARQLRLRDLAGLIVIDFIDMEDGRNNMNVERRFRESMRSDRARIQIGRISQFGLLELSRQRLRPSLLETHFEKCSVCAGSGYVRAPESSALAILRLLEDEGLRKGPGEITVQLPGKVALYLLNNKRSVVSAIEKRYNLVIEFVEADIQDYTITRTRTRQGDDTHSVVSVDQIMDMPSGQEGLPAVQNQSFAAMAEATGQRGEHRGGEHREGGRDGGRDTGRDGGRDGGRDHRRGGRRGGGRWNNQPRQAQGQHQGQQAAGFQPVDANPQGADMSLVSGFAGSDPAQGPMEGVNENYQSGGQNYGEQGDDDRGGRGRRRGRRGGRRRQQGRDRFERGPQQGTTHQDQSYAGQGMAGQEHGADMATGGDGAASYARGPIAAESRPAPSATIVPLYVEPPSEDHGGEKYASKFEVVNPTPDKPKMGWWQRLTSGKE